MTKNDGGPAFGHGNHEQGGDPGMTIRDYFAAHAPLPPDSEIDLWMRVDRSRNPHNEPYHNKPKIRSRGEIIACLAYEYADALLAERDRT